MDLITIATQSVLVLTVVLVASWMLMEWAEGRRAAREQHGTATIRVVSGGGLKAVSAHQREVRGGI
jgi:hypothetical protein